MNINDDQLIVGKKYQYFRINGTLNPNILVFGERTSFYSMFFYRIDGKKVYFSYESGSQARKCWLVVNTFKYGRNDYKFKIWKTLYNKRRGHKYIRKTINGLHLNQTRRLP